MERSYLGTYVWLYAKGYQWHKHAAHSRPCDRHGDSRSWTSERIAQLTTKSISNTSYRGGFTIRENSDSKKLDERARLLWPSEPSTEWQRH